LINSFNDIFLKDHGCDCDCKLHENGLKLRNCNSNINILSSIYIYIILSIIALHSLQISSSSSSTTHIWSVSEFESSVSLWDPLVNLARWDVMRCYRWKPKVCWPCECSLSNFIEHLEWKNYIMRDIGISYNVSFLIINFFYGNARSYFAHESYFCHSFGPGINECMLEEPRKDFAVSGRPKEQTLRNIAWKVANFKISLMSNTSLDSSKSEYLQSIIH
jgi:hypothetical protein